MSEPLLLNDRDETSIPKIEDFGDFRDAILEFSSLLLENMLLPVEMLLVCPLSVEEGEPSENITPDPKVRQGK